ncbi:beta-N-acetylhexosaminidase [Thiohalomonas denitrificans]|uniref:beta-N-acetylhexosaminidase n=1 Tax=Thiohalomonas denitrificans TaxID=415747 RepID=UPI0026EBEB21|nr:beta-N-acetylhexosaminidase [Thiohalomonas denitrificans]
MSLGPVMVDVNGTALELDEREMLRHPAVGGVILFSRNYHDVDQLRALVAEIHAVREPHLLVAVDHEGGRVQRFRSGFTRLPRARRLGDVHERDPSRARRLSQTAGWVMARELRAVGIDFSFAPVLDLERGVSGVIGDRAFHSDPEIVSDLAGAYILGMREAGMAATAKHFPGHGAVIEDSHEAIPVDERRFADIFAEDVLPFERLIRQGLAAVMPAHVIYSRVVPEPAGFSPFWLQEVLRERLGFQGVVFSDDLDMEGASVAGDYPERAKAALGAGCDMAIICNNPPAAARILDGLGENNNPVLHARLARMHGLHPVTLSELHRDPHWRRASEALHALEDDPSLELGI